MRKFLVLLLFVICSLLFVTSVTFAQEATSSASLDPNIKQKLQDLQSQIASKAAILKREINQKLLNRAYVGVVRKISGTTVGLYTRSGDKVVKLTQDTEYVTASGKKLTLKDLEVGDYIASLGDIDEAESLTAKKIIWQREQLPPQQVIWGEVQASPGPGLVIQDRDHKQWLIKIKTKTDTTIQTEGPIIVVGTKKRPFEILARFIYLFPKGQTKAK